MDIYKQINIILNEAEIQENMKDFQLVQHVLAFSDNTFQYRIIQQKDTGNNKICSATLINNTLYYQCFDCCKEPNHVYFQECFIPEKHKNHAVTYDYLKFGFYGCGDILIMKKKSLCNKHSQIQNEITIPEKLFGLNVIERF
ncbi:unnamed protein product [Paramecium pentaurelia]|uniref:UBR-type domain-containing protein n=1 Tax=Paramecium pentaurelia TaxID=43138 RepID=A0A8S1XE81_9CILI|nr:unnamed protein product [Paramecium pentaurelia]